MTSPKPFWQSTTLWANLVAAVALFVQSEYGFVIDPIVQGYILALVNAALRFKTKTAVSVAPTV
ncbi:MAG TPA: hypothetical protein VGN57_18925 [Pirellulaceae bacterium]|jgi:hypothetical protein|nr:hypothetical protein [Pirellulaceae bacterium]